MEQQLIDFMNQFGYLGIVLLIALENVFPPIPSEVILTFAGFMTLAADLTITGSVIAATIGAVLGAVILYGIGHWLNEERLQRLVQSRFGRLLRLKQSDVTKTANLFKKHGGKTVFFGRFIPVIRSLISIPAGMTRMKWQSFILFTTVGTLIWSVVLIVLGRMAGHAWTQVSAAVDTFSTMTIIVLAILLLVGGIWYYVKRIRVKSN
ncbi:DedA family protein [Furfurilactobacillus milii]|uniref:DedA family protein n=1 Tax=Furfurilactobacillus rossiae TaxID=231049 RepID=A0A7C9IUS2_9LACO|nr:DedA family protein [Furfurilactobacillus milii]MYV05774.1 DedA family protein [Furfurilactobacillus milii]